MKDTEIDEVESVVATEKQESNLVKFARNELDMLLNKCGDEHSESYTMQKCVNDEILEIVKTFSKQEHSGFSASYALNILKKLLDFKPISPLTGEDDEWNECGWTIDDSKLVFQNRRCSAVFKTLNVKTGEIETTYNDKYAISDNGGITFFYSKSILKQLGLSECISFPFKVPENPEKVYIKYLKDVPIGETGDEFIDITGNQDEISKLRAVYNRKFHPEKYEETDEKGGCKEK